MTAPEHPVGDTSRDEAVTEQVLGALRSEGWRVHSEAERTGAGPVYAAEFVADPEVTGGRPIRIGVVPFGSRSAPKISPGSLPGLKTDPDAVYLFGHWNLRAKAPVDNRRLNWVLMTAQGERRFTVGIKDLPENLKRYMGSSEGGLAEDIPNTAQMKVQRPLGAEEKADPENSELDPKTTRDSTVNRLLIALEAEGWSIEPEVSVGPVGEKMQVDAAISHADLPGIRRFILELEIANNPSAESKAFFDRLAALRNLAREPVLGIFINIENVVGFDKKPIEWRFLWEAGVYQFESSFRDLVAHLRMVLRKASQESSPHTDETDTADITVRRDDAEREHDSLGRAPLAISLAWTLHEIWCTEQGLKPYPARTPDPDGAAFVAHIDAPWGGGKTTFANLLARTLNPDLDGHAPAFLKALYPDREDMSGLFIRDAHQSGNLKEGADAYRWQEEARRPWIVVAFNAWRHAHVDPPWWCFYQAIRKGCFTAVRREGVPEVRQEADRSGTSRWRRLFGDFRFFGIGFRRQAPEPAAEGERYRTRRDGRLTRWLRWLRLWLREIVWRLTSGRLVMSLAVVVLSLAVGLALLDAGALQIKDGKPVLGTLSGVGVVVTFLLGAGAFIRAAVTVVVDALAPGRTVPGERLSLGVGDPIARFRCHFAAMMTDLGRPVLVVIDDIDRCEPDFIVDLTRGLQTILKSPRVVYLILGDRNWIEKAFEVRHEEMSGIDVGPEHSFGGRFVEKAIQLSFVLPAMADHKEAFVREVLLGRTEGAPGTDGVAASGAPSTEVSSSTRKKLRGRLTEAASVEDIDARASELEAEPQAGTEPGHRQAVREEVILERAARKEEVQRAIRHRLQPLAPYLPGNPRHIKRIINAISMYQDSLLLTEDSLEEAGIGKRRWRQLVIGVVLMMGYPKSWSLLARDPSLADDLIDGAAPRTGKAATERDQRLAHLRANPALADLLSKTRFLSASGEAAETRIDAEAVGWLNRLIPTRG